MELKAYFDNLRELSKTRQIKWIRRENAGPHIFDCRIDQNNTVTLHYDVMVSRTSITIVAGEVATSIASLDVYGETYRSLSKLWDTVLTLNLGNPAEKWNEVLPELDKKIKFGPKEKKRV